MIGISILSLVLIVALAVFIFLWTSPQVGRAPSKAQLAEYDKTDHHKDGKFFNYEHTPMPMPGWRAMWEFMKTDPKRSPSINIEVQKIDSLEIVGRKGGPSQVTWFGHSAFLVEMDGKIILLDPMLGEKPSPHPWFGSARYNKDLPLAIEKHPEIDAVLFSHDHYDHLDYPTVMKIKDRVKAWYVPLGLDNHLMRWGVDSNRIFVADWWDSFDANGLQFTSAPARHFSGRSLGDQSNTLWCSWILESDAEKIYFSGDGGYGSHFKEIGERHGPFDLAMMECGQYHEAWSNIHMMPEETVQAGIDVEAKVIMPIHWGAFTLALHSWTDPIERAKAEATAKGIPLTSPAIGETFQLGQETYPNSEWWELYR